MRARTAIKLLVGLLIAEVAIAGGALAFGAAFLGLIVSILAIAMAVFCLTTAYSVFYGAPWVPTDDRNVDEMLRIADVKAGDRVADLGSGDGRILIAAAKRGAIAEGWEISPFLWLYAWWNIRRAGMQERARTHLASFWPADTSRFDVVTLFLIDTQMKTMEGKLKKELRPGSRVSSYAFRFPTWTPAAENGHGTRLYVKE
jgi:SAM-dependent methyltransferase